MSESNLPPAEKRATSRAGGARRLVDLAQDVGVAGSRAARATVGRGRSESGAAVRPAFDHHHPPDPALIDDCVHCGFCLPTCPTYLLFGEEMDSPRGRIYLMQEAHEGETMNASMVRHWDLCLGCLACVTACPSGVQYGKLIESTRQQVERRYPRGLRDRLYRELLYRVFPYPDRLERLAIPLRLYQRVGLQTAVRRTGLVRRLPEPFRTLEGLTPQLPSQPSKVPVWSPARGHHRGTAGLLLGCVQRVFFPAVNAATVRVLQAEGYAVASPLGQGCCGALSLHAGREAESRRFARRTIDVFEAAAVDYLVVNAAGCGSVLKEYGYLLRDDPAYADRAARFSQQVRDISELLQEAEPVTERHPLPLTAVYHDACHLAHGQGVRQQPRQLLAAIPELRVKEVPREREICCGSAGTYNLLEPGPARDLGERKARNVLETSAQLLVTANPGCDLQISAALRRLGASLPTAHVIEVLDASISGTPLEQLLDHRGPGLEPVTSP